MPNNIFRLSSVGVLLLFCVGCGTTSQGYRYRAFAQDKPRVDQHMQGNGGYVFGEPIVEDRSDIKKTRKIYVFEVTAMENPVEFSDDGYQYRKSSSILNPESRTETITTVERSSHVSYPDYEKVDPDAIQEGIAINSSELVDYTVEKDDTLQKISKKFYGSFSKWPRIYDENRDVLKSPKDLKPGMVLRVPVNE